MPSEQETSALMARHSNADPMRTRLTPLWGMLLAALWLAGCGDGDPPVRSTAPQPVATDAAARPRTIVAMGDSLTEGYGVEEEEAYPALLEARLRGAGYAVRVINAGVSGETSSGARSRVDWVLTQRPEVVILETGANDGFRGIDPALIEENIEAIVARLQSGGATVVLAGMQIVRNLGQPYTRAFAAIYPRVAERRGAVLIPFFLQGVAAVPALNQTDGIHPNAEGYRVVTATVYPYVLEALAGPGGS
jgi:acyl-CoA thioesterase-1